VWKHFKYRKKSVAMYEKEGRNGGKLKMMEKGDPPLPGGGRPKGSSTISAKFKKFLEGVEDYTLKDGTVVKMTREEILMFRLYAVALKGDDTLAGESKGVSIAAIREIHDRTHGKPLQTTELNANIETSAKYKLPDGTEIEI
jgi:hypothetical protein